MTSMNSVFVRAYGSSTLGTESDIALDRRKRKAKVRTTKIGTTKRVGIMTIFKAGKPGARDHE